MRNNFLLDINLCWQTVLERRFRKGVFIASSFFFVNTETLPKTWNSLHLVLKYDKKIRHFVSEKYWYSGERESRKILRTSSFSSINSFRTFTLATKLAPVAREGTCSWSACIHSHKTANNTAFNGRAFTEFTNFAISCSAEYNFGSKSRDAESPLVMMQCMKFAWGPICLN